MKFRVTILVDQADLGNVLAPLQGLPAQVAGVEALIETKTRAMRQPRAPAALEAPKNVTPSHIKPASFTSKLFDLIKKGPITSKDAITYARKLGKTDQAAYGALDTLQKKGWVHRMEDRRYAETIQHRVEVDENV